MSNIIQRKIQPQVIKGLKKGYVAVVYGARQTGKTTLAQEISKEFKKTLYLNCDEIDVRARLTDQTSTQLGALIGDADLIIIDEAQRVINIGLSAKIIHDSFPKKQLLLTGSSSIDLANTIKEPLTGRSLEFALYPLSIQELAENSLEAKRLLDKQIVFGGYPAMWHMNAHDAAEYLRNIAHNYLYRDAFAPNTIFDTTVIDLLLRLLAFQVGSEVSYNELALKLGINKETVMRYIDLLEKAFIVFRVNQYRRNKRSEVGRLRKIYFYDMGIRNGIIDNFKPLSLRDDVGGLWENYCIVERRKMLQFKESHAQEYFWRSRTKQEIDLIEEEAETLRSFEFKWGKTKRDIELPSGFKSEYGKIPFAVITPEDIFNSFIKI